MYACSKGNYVECLNSLQKLIETVAAAHGRSPDEARQYSKKAREMFEEYVSCSTDDVELCEALRDQLFDSLGKILAGLVCGHDVPIICPEAAQLELVIKRALENVIDGGEEPRFIMTSYALAKAVSDTLFYGLAKVKAETVCYKDISQLDAVYREVKMLLGVSGVKAVGLKLVAGKMAVTGDRIPREYLVRLLEMSGFTADEADRAIALLESRVANVAERCNQVLVIGP